MKTFALIDQDKKDKYEGTPNVFFTEKMDYEEDIYASFKLHDYLLCCKEMGMLKSLISPIKRIEPNLDVNAFLENPNSLQINDDEEARLMLEVKDEQLKKLKGSKNACKGALLAEYVTQIPPAFDKLIDLLSNEVCR